MKDTLYPLVVMPAVPYNGKIKFLPYGTQTWIIDNHVDIIWAILEEARGYKDSDKLIASVQKKLPNASKEDVVAVFDHLMELGVIFNRREAYRSVLPILSNPSIFPPLMTQAEVRDYTASSRVGVKSGITYSLKPFAEDDALAKLQASRRSCRSFSKTKNLSLATLSRILMHAYSLPLHSTPSGGGLYPLKLYVILTRDQIDLPQGYYEYDPEKHEINHYGQIDTELMQYVFANETLLHNAPAIIVIAADLKRQSMKYGDRAYLLGALEAGIAAENIHLASVQEGLATLQHGGFAEKKLMAELGMNSELEYEQVWPFTAVALGHPSKEVLPNYEVQLEKLADELIGRGKPVQGIYNVAIDGKRGAITFFGIHANARFADSPKHKLIAAGTGTSLSLAKLKAIAESYERYASGLVRIERRASADEIIKAHEQWLDPRVVAPLTKEQYKLLTRYEPFSEKRQWEWVKGYLAKTNNPIWVPIELAFYPIVTESLGRKLCTGASSSGVAAYSTESEAIRRALFELLERHATMDSWLRRESLRPIDSNILPYHWKRRVEYWKYKDRQVHVLDMTDRAQGMVAVSVMITGNTFPFFVSGSACADTFEAALAKAFNEAELFLMCFKKPRRKNYLEPNEVGDVLDHPLLYAQSSQHTDKLKWLWSGKKKNELPVATKTVEQVMTDIDAVIVRLSPPDAPLYVFRVLSKNLIPINFGYGTNYYAHQSLKGKVDKINSNLPHYFP